MDTSDPTSSPVQFGPSQDNQSTVDITPGMPQVSPEVAEARSQKAAYGLKPYLPDMDKDAWYTNIISGQENQGRQAAASAANYVDMQSRIQQFKDTGTIPPPKLATPDSIIEDAYAKRFTDPLTNPTGFMASSLYGRANDASPGMVAAVADASAKIGSKVQQDQTDADNNGQFTLGTQGTSFANPEVAMKYTANQLDNMIQFAANHPWLSAAGLNPYKITVPIAFAGVIGSGTIALADSMFKTAQKAWDEGLSPEEEQDFGRNASLLEIGGGNTFKVPPIVHAIAEAGTDAVVAMSKVPPGVPIETAANAVHGDLKEAAVHQATADVLAGDSPKAENDRDVRSLTSHLRIDMIGIENDPGTYGADIVNRIRDANQNFVKNLSDKTVDVMKVNRTPEAIAQEDVVRGEADRVRGNYRGVGNAILDVKFDPEQDYNKLTNTYSTRTWFGTFDGEMFTTPEQARLFAELHGIHVEELPVKNDPVGKMNSGPFDFNSFKEFRDAAGNAGLKAKDLRDAGLGNTKAWEASKARLGSTQIDTGASLCSTQGSGYYIEKRTPFNENSEALLGHPDTGLGTTPDTRSPRSWWNARFKGGASSPPMALSRAEMANRRITAHSPSVLKRLAVPEWEIINRIHKDNWTKFNQLLEYGRDLYDKNGDKGYFFESPGEIEDWNSMFFPNDGRPPGDVIEGYFAHKRLYNMDLAMRNISMYQFAARLGTELHNWSVGDGAGGQIQSGDIQGIKRSTMPYGDHAVLILGKNKGDEQIVSAKKLGTTKLGQKVQEDILNGQAHHVELWDPDRKELGKISPRSNQARVRSVISYKPPTTRPLDVGTMVPRRGGGHFDYDWEYATAQPKVEFDKVTGKYNYTGDRIITVHNNPGEAKDFANNMNRVRKYRQEGYYDEAREAARRTLHMGDDQFNQWFGEREMPNGGKLAPYLDNEQPIRQIRRGKSTIDYDNQLRTKYGSDFRDATTSGSAAAQFKVQYTQARDAEQLFTAQNKGTWGNPLWEYEPAKMLNPIQVLGRAINRIANSQAGDSMKIAAITNWLKAAEPHMNYGPNTHAIIWSTPWRTFNNDIRWSMTEENQHIIRQLEGDRKKIQTFSGAFNPNERFMHNQAARLATSLYDSYGPKSSIAPTWMLPKLSDPWTVARTIAVHPILGMFKPSAFGMQLSTFSNVMGIAGARSGSAGFMGALMHEFTRLNDHPNVIAHWDELLSKGPEWGWKPGQFTEAWQKLMDSGFFDVGNEHSYVDDPTSYNPVYSAARSVVQAGMTPFQEGAQFVRAASWFTAYHEFRNGGGGKFFQDTNGWKSNYEGQGDKLMSREDWEKVLNRAGTLDHNMSRAATAPYQQGAASIPTMFWAYKLRLTELMLSKQLTVAEKIRLFTVSTLMYGGLYGGAGLVGLPVGDYVRSSMLSGNWDVPFSQEITGQPINLFHSVPYTMGNNFWLSSAIEGLPATFVAWLTGALDSNKSIAQNLLDLNKKSFGQAMKDGNHYNIGEYFGNHSLVGDMMRDQTVMEMVAGAPGTFFAQAFKTAHQLGWDFYNWAVNHDKGTTLNDVLEAARSINAINVGYQTVTAIATHNWMTRNNTVMQGGVNGDPVSAGNAVFMGASGLHDQKALDNYERRNIMNKANQARNDAEFHATQEIHFMLQARQDQDPDAEQAHKVKANSWLAAAGYPEEKYPQFYGRAEKSFQKNVPESIADKFFNPDRYPKGVSDEQLEDAAKSYYEDVGPTPKERKDAKAAEKAAAKADKAANPRSHHKQ